MGRNCLCSYLVIIAMMSSVIAQQSCNVTNCNRYYCTVDMKCNRCNEGYFPSEDRSKCLECSAVDSLDYSEFSCEVCNPGFIYGGLCTSSGESECEPGCDICDSKTGMCLLCFKGNYLDGGVCKSCPTGCISCTGSDQCSLCYSGFFLSSSSVCEACNSTCETCNGTAANKCLSCPPKRYLTDTGTCEVWSCVQSGCAQCAEDGIACASCVSDRYYLDSGSCLVCDSNCGSCSGPSSSDCTSCDDGRYLNSTTNTCQACDPDCLTCTGPGSCTSCDDFREYLNATSGRCAGCHGSCVSCIGPLIGDCTQCYVQSGNYLAGPAPAECRVCDPSCARCTGPGPDRCTACSGSYLYRQDENSADGTCIICDSSCSGCSGTGPNDCLSCPFTGRYQDGTTCPACHDSCFKCSGPGPDACTACNNGYLYQPGNANSGTCYVCGSSCSACYGITVIDCLTCPFGRYLTGTPPSTCAICHTTCKGCTGGGPGDCTACTSASYFTGGNPACQACHSSCVTCVGPSADNCTSCPDGSYFNPTGQAGSCLDCPPDISSLTEDQCIYGCGSLFNYNQWRTTCRATCEQISDYCYNGGSCVMSQAGVSCACVQPYIGPRCNQTIEDQCEIDRSYCRNGGSCYADKGGVFCNCVEPYIGPQCEQMEQGTEMTAELTIENTTSLFGPMAGGSTIGITLSSDSSFGEVTDVFIGDLTCNLTMQTVSTETNRNSITVFCATPTFSMDLPDAVELPIVLQFEHKNRTSTGLRFQYNPNPMVMRIHPLETIVSGGNTLTVSGSSLAAASEPLMRILTFFYNRNDNTETTYISQASVCSIVTNSQINCPVPELNIPPGLLAMATSGPAPSRRKRQTQSDNNHPDNTKRQTQSDNNDPQNTKRQTQSDNNDPENIEDDEADNRKSNSHLKAIDNNLDQKLLGDQAAKIVGYTIKRQKRQTGVGSRMIDIEEVDGYVRFYISLQFDGDRTYDNVSTVLPASGEVTAYFDMQVATWPQALAFRPSWPHNDEFIDIGGQGMTYGVQPQDIKVAIGLGRCTIEEVTDITITCRPPTSPDGLADERGVIDVRVMVGIGNYDARIGEIYYPENYQLILTGVMPFVGVILIALLIYFCLRKPQKKKSKPSDRSTYAASKGTGVYLNKPPVPVINLM